MVLAIVIPLSFGACGSDGSVEVFYYSVNVINNTDASITVKYDEEETLWGGYDWAQQDTIAIKGSKNIVWFSDTFNRENIEVDYKGKWKYYYVNMGENTVHVYVGDFP